MRMSPIVAFGIAAAGIGTLVLVLSLLFPGALSAQGGNPHFVFTISLLTLLISSALLSRRTGDLKEGLRNGLIWVVILAALVMAYSLKDEFEGLGKRMAGALMPSMAVQEAGGAVSLRRSDNGHFMARAEVTGPDLDTATVIFLVDTGASRVALPQADARRLGIDTGRLNYAMPINTANGMAMAAPVRLTRIVIGDVVVTDVPALVTQEGLSSPLLGMSFLDRLGSYGVEGDRLILTPADRF